ncbi:MAG TPA: long-chain fatty acid--CoA ligase [Aquabacterium sp.]|uniref:AMP-dependent synthetase/ligase n=1 Tax=Aquabacterium sp. TaxID=1872578 RepID=UPI002E3186C9|nr:long-chain fatty acid--CoA ligase [Aquabacterium sp.]HEX5357582.1 long-chain fatty acid--CoA ligase [Aquabacterium sp.]
MPPISAAESARPWPSPTSNNREQASQATVFADFIAPPLKLFETASRLASKPAYWVRGEHDWQACNWQDYAAQIRQAARALLALGVEHGDAVAILSFNRPEWSIAAYAAMSIGAIPVGIYWTSSTADIEYILNHCKAPVLVLEDDDRFDCVEACAERLQHLRHVVQIKGAPKSLANRQTMPWQDFMVQGLGSQEAEYERLINKRLAAIQPQDTASLIYTSGTTGPSKAVMLSHGNLWWTANTMGQLFHVDENDRMISYLPLAHIAEQMATMHNQVYGGFAVYFAQSIDKLGEHLKEVKPTIFFGVPRVWEKMQVAIEAKLAQATGFKATMARWALQVGQRWNAQDQAGMRPSPWLTLQKNLANKLIYRKVQEALGFDQARLLVTAAAPISPESLRFFSGLNIHVREGYGQSEACGPSTLSLPEHTKIGSVGKALPGTEIRAADDGELLIRGPHIFHGYMGQPAATAQTIVDDWLLTGDLGHVDEEGYVYITGRKKDLIITSGGKNISPANIEASLMDSHLIEYAVVCGDGRNYLTALLTLEAQGLADFAKANGLEVTPDLHKHPKVQAALQKAVDHTNELQARVAQIRKFAVLTDPFTIEGGELTPTLKVKRKVVLERQQALINALYAN